MTRAGSIAVLAVLVSTAPVAAQDEEWEEEAGAEASEEEGDQEEAGEEDSTEAEAEDEEDTDEEARPAAAREWYFGPYFRFMLVPAFIPQLFLDEAPTVEGPGFGATATMRGDTVHIELGLGYQSYAFEDPFRAAGDPVIDTEWVESSLGLVHVTASMLWDTELSRKLTFEYGFGGDLGIVTGEMVRTEAYPVGGGYAPCLGVGNPPPPTAPPGYCEPGEVAYDQEGAHYNVVEERVPPIALIPMIPHLALRWAPATEWVVKAEMAYGIVQFWFGLSAAYGPEL